MNRHKLKTSLVEQLAEESERADQNQEQLDALRDVFRKKLTTTPHSRNSGSAVRQFDPKTKGVAIACACEDEFSTSIHRVMITITQVCPELLDCDNAAVPSIFVIDEWRDLIRGFNQVAASIEEAVRIVLSVDATDVSNTSLLSIGAYNQDMDIICLAFMAAKLELSIFKP